MSNYHSQGAKGQYMYRCGQFAESPLYYGEIGKLDYTCPTPLLSHGGSTTPSLERKNPCCTLVWAFVKKSANCNSEGTYEELESCPAQQCAEWRHQRRCVWCVMLHWISRNDDSICTVWQDGSRCHTLKFSNNHRNQVTSAVKLAIALNSASAFERETAVYFFVFHAMREPPRNTH
jgi:hypothetical protein